MYIYGLDFTSAPRHHKPITCAECVLEDGTLRVRDFTELTDFTQFEAFLAHPGPWVAGLDFPFGQPARLVRALEWGETWQDYVGVVADMSKQAFVDMLKVYKDARPPGDKQHLRRTDELARSCSPMMLYGVPVGKMFFEGAPRLLASGVQVVPCYMNGDSRVVVEAYPALVARKWANHGYKSDTKRKQTEAHRDARQAIVTGLQAECRARYGFDLELDETMAADFIKDPTGDALDAVLCAVQAAWTCSKPDYGIPAGCDPLEGWIVDPDMLRDEGRKHSPSSRRRSTAKPRYA